MAQKMTDADRNHLRGIAVTRWRQRGRGGEAGVIDAADAVADEVLAWLAEKDAQIAALASALEKERSLTGVACGCSPGYVCVACEGENALRPVGRL